VNLEDTLRQIHAHRTDLAHGRLLQVVLNTATRTQRGRWGVAPWFQLDAAIHLRAVPGRSFRVRLVSGVCPLECWVFRGVPVHSRNTRICFQWNLESSCCVKLRHEIHVGEARIRAKAVAAVSNESFHRRKTLSDPFGDPIRYLRFGETEAPT
jgi:hypothetical protein